MRSYAGTIRAVLFLAALVLSPANAVVITFEDLITNGPGTGGQTVVNNQYASQGVTFNSPVALDYSKGIPIPGFAHSGNIAIEQCYAAEFCFAPISISFTAGQSRVKVWVGASYNLQQTSTVMMRGYNAAGTEIVSSTVTLPASPNAPTLIRVPLEVGRLASDIRKVDIGFTPFGTATNNGLAIDDLEFVTVGPPPPCPATVPPTVNINNPSNGTVTRCNRFLYGDTVTTQDPFARRIVTVRGTQMGQRTSWVSQATSGTSGSTWIYEALFPGTNIVTVRIEDCKGAVERSVNVTYDPLPEDTRIVVLGFEPTQSVQTMPNSVQLISGKRTVIRVYLKLEGSLASLPGIRGRLSAFLPGTDPQWYLGAPIAPFSVQSQNAVTVLPTMTLLTARRTLTASLNFEVPTSWTTAGRVHFQLTGLSLDGCDTRLNVEGADNTLPIGYYSYNTFVEAPPVRLRIVDVPYQTTSAGPVHTPRQRDVDFLRSWLQRAYPTAEVLSSRLTLATRTGTPDSSFDADDVNSQLQDVRSMETSNGSVHRKTKYYGLVFDGGGFMRGKADGIPSWVASGPTGPGSFGWDTDGSYGDWYGGHELGHTFGRHHAQFCGAVACFEFIWTFCPPGYEGYPFPGGLLDNNVEFGNFGFDVGDPSLSLPMKIYRPDIAHDIMTYCDDEWLSDFTYGRILDRLREENPAGLTEAAEAVIPDALLVSATMNLTQETAQLRPFWRLPNLEATERPTESHYKIELRDAANNVLATYLFAPKVDTEAVAGEDFTGSMSEVVPWVNGTRRIVIMRDEVEMASRTVTANTPSVQVTSPNGGENLTGQTATFTWQGSDADGQPLVYALHYSRNSGQTWQVIDSGIQATSYTVNLDKIPGSSSALFRVYATDGVNTGVDTSNATFSVRNKPPEARIISPGDGAEYDSSDTVVFKGEAADEEDGYLSGPAMQWFSNLQGPLGSGTSISASLIPGNHTVTLSGADTGGETGQASVSLSVSAAPPVADAGEDRPAVVGAPVSLDGGNSRGVPTLTYLWEIISQPDDASATLTGADTLTPTFTPDRPGPYLVQLTVTDGMGVKAITRVIIDATTSTNALRIAGGLAGSTAGDMTMMNVDISGVSATVIDIADALRLTRQAMLARNGGGVVTVNNANRWDGGNTGVWYGVAIDDPRLNGRPELRVMATHQFIGAYGDPLAVTYDSSIQRWVVFNENRVAMQVGEKINYVFGQEIGAVTRNAASGPFGWGVYLDDPRLNFNPDAIVLAMHASRGTPGDALGVWFNGTKWVAYNESGAAIADTERYYYLDAGASGGRAIRSAANAYSTYGVILDDPRINGKSDAIIIAQHAGQGSYNPSPMGVWYDGSRWVVYNENRTPFGDGEAVHYLVVSP